MFSPARVPHALPREESKKLERGSAPARGVSLLLVYAGSGLLLGASWLHPALAALAWLGAALLAAALHRTVDSPGRALLGVFVSLYGAHLLAFGWTVDMMAVLLRLDPLHHWAYALGNLGFCVLPPILSLGLAWVLLSGRLGVQWWFPAAYGLGEYGRLQTLGMTIDDWLMTQWTVPPVLRAVGLLGWWPTLLLCLTACAAAGVAVAERRWRAAAPVPLVAALLLALPPLPAGDLSQLAQVAAVHTRSSVDLPHRLPSDDALKLVIWPEAVFDFRPMLGEGEGRGATLPPLPGEPSVVHLVGLLTRSPSGGELNQLVAMQSDGTVLRSRAKHMLFPVTERRFLGLGQDRFTRGRSPPRMTVAGLELLPMVCGEYLWPQIVARGAEEGARLLVVASRDGMLTSEAARRQVLAIQVLRSVQVGLPSVRASFEGRAAFVAADGRVLAQSDLARNGLLLWSEAQGGRDHDFTGQPMDQPPPPPEPAPIAVLYAAEAPRYRTRCPEGRCSYHALEDLQCEGAAAEAVVVAGHGSPPSYLSHSPAEIAAAVGCFHPALVVVDACYGASAALLSALAEVAPRVVAVPRLLPDSGFEYDEGFFRLGASAEARALAVRARDGGPVLRAALDAEALAAVLAEVAQMSPEALGARLARRRPSQVGMPFGGLDPGVLVSVPDEALRLQARPALPAGGD